MQLTPFIVFWTRKGWKRAFQADIHARNPRNARESFRKLFPGDLIIGVKRHPGGPFLA